MTDRFIDNFTPGSGGDGLSWANAELTAAAVDAADAAGDRWLFDHRHSESTAGAVTLTVAGSLTSPSQLLSVTQTGASGVSALTAGATIATTTTNQITLNGDFYAYGLTFQNGSGASTSDMTMAGDNQYYDTCTFILNTSSVNSNFLASASGTDGRLFYKDCQFKFGNASQAFELINGLISFEGGSIASGSTALTTSFLRFNTSQRGVTAYINGFDFSNLGSACNLVNVASMATGGRVVFTNCKLPASWTGTLTTGSFSNPSNSVEMYNCSNADTNYELWIEHYLGTVRHETTLIKTGGASDGTTGLSWKMTTKANAEYPSLVFRTPEIHKWNETTGSAITVTVDILHDSATNLKDNEVWIDVEYMGTSGFPLSIFTDDSVADVITTAADQTASAATWTTTGMANPNKQKLSVTFTPQEKGLIIVQVCVAKASYTLYVDPLVTVS